MDSKERFERACRGEAVDHPPVWIMRQAGRTLPEYRQLRERHSFWEICRTPELAAEVTLQPIRRFGMDVAVVFSDILVVPAAMGLGIRFEPELSVDPPVRSGDDVARLVRPDVAAALGYVGDAIRATRREGGERLPVLGFSGAPYTLAAYMVEGGGARRFEQLRTLAHGRPEAFEALMSIVSEVVIDYLRMQVDAGAAAVQLFDTCAGDLAMDDYRRIVLPYVARIVGAIQARGAPVIYYVYAGGHLVEAARESDARVLGMDWRTPLGQVRRRLGSSLVLQGNLDPAALFAGDDEIRARVFRMLDETGGVGHIANLGHGVIPETPIAGIEAFVRSVREWKVRP